MTWYFFKSKNFSSFWTKQISNFWTATAGQFVHWHTSVWDGMRDQSWLGSCQTVLGQHWSTELCRPCSRYVQTRHYFASLTQQDTDPFSAGHTFVASSCNWNTLWILFTSLKSALGCLRIACWTFQSNRLKELRATQAPPNFAILPSK